MKKYFILLLLLTSCSSVEQEISEEYNFHPFIDDCDRFRPLFLDVMSGYEELNDYPLSLIYAQTYQETLCKTAYELKTEWNEEEYYKGGIMQVDGCWRWGSPKDCSSIRKEVESGIEELVFALNKVKNAVQENGLVLTSEEEQDLFLVSYNRGYRTVELGIQIYSNYLKNNDYTLQGIVTQEDEIKVFVECSESDRCLNDGEWIVVEESDPWTTSMLIGCKHNFGNLLYDGRDFCAGEGYNHNYPIMIRKIQEDIERGEPTGFSRYWQKEYYSNSLVFSDREWLVKAGFDGPGPNNWGHSDSVSVDGNGLLLNFIEREGTFYSSEIVLRESLGHGKYSFLVSGFDKNLDKNLVLGLFTYDLNTTVPYRREIDIEFAKWGNDLDDNVQLGIQGPKPYEVIDRLYVNQTELFWYSFNWQEGLINFTIENLDREVIHSYYYEGPLVPLPGTEKVRMNLWLFNSSVDIPAETHLLIKEFEFSK